MKLLLSAALTAVLVAVPVPVEAKSKASHSAARSCWGAQTVQYRHGNKITRTYFACPPKIRKQRFVSFHTGS